MFREPATNNTSDPLHYATLAALFNQVNAAISHVAVAPESPTCSHAALSSLANLEEAVRFARKRLREHIARV